jgi:hypothetical protein
MTENNPIRESEPESDDRQSPGDEWHEQTDVQVTVLSDDEESSQSAGQLRVFEPESDDESTVALSVESLAELCAVELDAGRALVLADEIKQVAERGLHRTNHE